MSDPLAAEPSSSITNAQKLRALPWAMGGDALNVVYVYLAFFGPVFLLFLDTIGLDKKRIGVVLAIISFSMVLTVAFMPTVARLGYKRVYVVAWVTRTFVLSGLMAVPWVIGRWGADAGYWLAVVVIAGFSLLRSVGVTALGPWAQEFVPAGVRGKYSAVQSFVLVFFGAATPAVAGWWLGEKPDRGAFIALFATAVVFGLGSPLLYSRVPGGRPVRSGMRERADFASVLDALRDRQFMLFLFGIALLTLGWAPLSMSNFLPLFLKEQVKLTANEVMYYNAVWQGAGVLTGLIWGWAADRYGYKPAMLITLAVLWMFPLSLWLLPLGKDYSFMVALGPAAVIGLMMPGWSVGYYRCLYVHLVPDDRRAAYTAVHFAWAGMMAGLAPLLAGFVLAATADWDGSFLGLKVGPYTPLMWSGLVFIGLAFAVLTRLRGESEIGVKRFASMFVQGNPVAAMQALVLYRFGGGENRRVSTTERLGQSRSPLSVEELIESLKDPSFNVRHEALVSIARTRPDEKLTTALIEVLQGGEPDMAITAAWALGRLDDKRAIAPLRVALDSEFRILQARAARALGTLGDQASAGRILEELERADDPGLRVAFASALGALAYEDALPEMLVLLRELVNPMQRRELTLAIASIVGREDWFALLSRRAQHDAGDAMGGVLLAMRRRLLRFTHTGRDAEVKRLLDQCVATLGDNERRAEGAAAFRELLLTLPDESFGDACRAMLYEAIDALEQYDDTKLDYILLTLHALHAGVAKESGTGSPHGRTADGE